MKTGKADLKRLSRRKKQSHKGENGTVLIIAGSTSYHGAPIFAGVTASRLVDLTFFATSRENIPIIKKLSPEFIVTGFSGIKKLLPKADSILIGPGLEQNNRVRNMVQRLVSKNKGKKFVLDATALRLISPKKLHSNCVVTPHASEFNSLFSMPATKSNCLKAAKKYGCIVALKGRVDFVSDGKKIFENSTGNSGMTTGGTGDILAGLIAGFAAKNDLLISARAALYLNGFAANMLQKEKGNMWNATDLMEIMPRAMKKLESS